MEITKRKQKRKYNEHKLFYNNYRQYIFIDSYVNLSLILFFYILIIIHQIILDFNIFSKRKTHLSAIFIFHSCLCFQYQNLSHPQTQIPENGKGKERSLISLINGSQP